jgi:hypothetical protein
VACGSLDGLRAVDASSARLARMRSRVPKPSVNCAYVFRSLCRRCRLPAFFQHSACECPRNTEKPEVSRSVDAGGTDKGSGNEIPQCCGDCSGRDVASGSDTLRPFERKWRREHREPAQGYALGIIEEVSRPGNGATEGPMSLGRGPAPRPTQRKLRIQQLGDGRECQRAHAPRGRAHSCRE